MHSDSVAQALREVKEYAARVSDINTDTLQMKLMHLDEVARRTQHNDRDLYAMVLQRFLCYKSHPSIGFLVSSLLSSPAEARILEKEQKFLKIHGQDSSKKASTKSPDEKDKSDQTALIQTMQNFMANMGIPRFPTPPPPRFGGPYPPFPVRPRQRSTRPTRCFLCGDASHYRSDCPLLK